MWLKLIIGGFFAALGLSLFISVLITPIKPSCARFYGTLALVILFPSLFLFVRGLKEFAKKVRR